MSESTPSLETWRRLYELAAQVRDMAPWEWMEEVDIIGIQHANTGAYDFISVMGNAGEYESIALYRGLEGYHGFWNVVDQGPYGSPMAILLVPQVQLSFTDRNELDKKERAVIKKLKMNFHGRGEWPQFRRYDPALEPWFITEDDAQVMIVALEQLLDVAPRFEEDESLLDPEDGESQFFRVPLDSNGTQWQDEFIIIPEQEEKTYDVTLDIETLQLLKGLRKEKTTVEVACNLTPTPVGQRGERAVFPFSMLVLETQGGLMLGAEIIEPLPTVDAVWQNAPKKLATIFKQAGLIPNQIHVQSDPLYQVLQPLAEAHKITLVKKDFLPMMDQAQNSLLNYLMNMNPNDLPDDLPFDF